MYYPKFVNIEQAAKNLEGVAYNTMLNRNTNLSKKFYANIIFKREDLQGVRSYKIRGAYNKISSLSEDEQQHRIICKTWYLNTSLTIHKTVMGNPLFSGKTNNYFKLTFY
jgi:threonine dehydratase|tara:strand:+ start:136 stop:465 length:330 start_codon:yes stop_codon:yes gene_type:complete